MPLNYKLSIILTGKLLIFDGWQKYLFKNIYFHTKIVVLKSYKAKTIKCEVSMNATNRIRSSISN